MKTSWTILGSGSGEPSAERSSAGYVLSCDERLIVFDCGSGVTSSFLRSGFDPLDVDAIVISHTHADHISDLPMFIQMQYLAQREKELSIYLPAEAARPIMGYLNACYLFKEKLPFALEFRPIESGIDFFDGRVVVCPVANQHLEGYAGIIREMDYPNRMECYSFLINVDDCSIFYSSDISSLDDIEKHLDRIDLLVIETTHIDLGQLANILSRHKVGRVVLSHIGDDDLQAIRRFAQNPPDGIEVIIAEDNLTIDI